MSKSKAHRDKIKAWKKQQDDEFLATLPFPESIFQDLFDFLGSKLENEPCQHNYNLTSKFLTSRGIDFKEQIYFFIEHSGGCDCEVLMNIEEAFPERDIEPQIKTEKPVKREKINFLKYQDLEIKSIPSPWKLFKSGDDYEFQFGKNQDIKIKLVKSLSVDNWHNDFYWQKEWESITELKIKSDKEMIYEELEDLEMATLKTQDWIPVLIWVRRKGNSSWMLMFRTELSRFRGDMHELKNLLKKIKKHTANST